MIYVVTGSPRSGTSMIMEALEAGGLPVIRSEERDEFGERHSDDDYKMNPTGLWESVTKELRKRGFPEKVDGYAVKLVFEVIKFMTPHWLEVDPYPLYRPGYRVLVMVRHPEEIRQSFRAALELDSAVILSEEQCKAAWRLYGRKVRTYIEYLHRRKDVLSLSILSYRRILLNPAKAFESLAWPLDKQEAVDVVDSKQTRFKFESLEIGV